MSDPFVTLLFGRVRPGKLDDVRNGYQGIVRLVQENEPRVLAFHAMLTDDEERFVNMQFHPDAESMQFHLQVVNEATKKFADLIDMEEFKVLGRSNPAVDGLLKSLADAGVKVEHLPIHVDGFTRSSATD